MYKLKFVWLYLFAMKWNFIYDFLLMHIVEDQ